MNNEAEFNRYEGGWALNLSGLVVAASMLGTFFEAG